MNKKRTYSIIFLVGLILFLIASYQYVMKSGGRNLQTETASFSITATELTSEFSKNVAVASKKYTEKAIQIKGLVTDMSNNQVILNGTVICQFEKKPIIKSGQTIIIKGRFVGFDDLLGELKLDQCYLIQ